MNSFENTTTEAFRTAYSHWMNIRVRRLTNGKFNCSDAKRPNVSLQETHKQSVNDRARQTGSSDLHLAVIFLVSQYFRRIPVRATAVIILASRSRSALVVGRCKCKSAIAVKRKESEQRKRHT